MKTVTLTEDHARVALAGLDALVRANGLGTAPIVMQAAASIEQQLAAKQEPQPPAES